MIAVRLALAGCLAAGLVSAATARAPAPAKEATNKEKLVGAWTPTKAAGGADATLEFTKDGKLNISIKLGDKALNLEGSYELDGDKLAVTIKGPDGKEKKDSMTIVKLTDEVLVTKDGMGKSEEFKRKKK